MSKLIKVTLLLWVFIATLELAASAGARSTTSSSTSGMRASRAKSRGRSRSNDHQTCHMREIDSCLDKVNGLTKDSANPSSILTTSNGLDKLCATANDILKCLKGYFKKCGTPLQREIYDLSMEAVTKAVRKFCDDGPEREIFLQSSPCIHSKVLSTNFYKTGCNTPYLAALDVVNNRTTIDDRIETMCCGHNTWEDCTEKAIGDACGQQSRERFSDFAERTFGGLTGVLCPRNVFPSSSKVCKAALPPPGTRPRGKVTDNFIGRYLNNYLSFLFNHF